MIHLPRNADSRVESGLRCRANRCNMQRFQSMIRKSGYRFSEKIMLKSKRQRRD